MKRRFNWEPVDAQVMVELLDSLHERVLGRMPCEGELHDTEGARRLLLHWWMRGIQRQLHAQYHQGVV